ncbi:hypothetical protein TNCV_3021261 [Trichonephila clavipes]|nr:hypothetical protein TNCV_3021261 [Trichonephila clavipes]
MLHSTVAGFVTRLECLLPCGGGHVEHILVAANWSHCSLYPATNKRAVTKLSAKSNTFPNSPSRRSTDATPPGSLRPSNRRHATKQNVKLHSRHAPHRRLVQIWD